MKKFGRILKKSIIIVMILTSLFIVANKNKTNADAGYHSSYGGGSSSSSSHSSGSSYSGSSHSGSSYSGSSYRSSRGGSYTSDDDIGSFIFAIIFMAFIIIIVIAASKAKGGTQTKYVPPLVKIQPNKAAVDKLKELIPGFDEQLFLDKGYKIFLDVEDAWMNFDLEKVHNVITDELLTMYESQISSMDIKGEQI